MAYASSPQLAFRAAFSSTLQKTKFYIALHFDAIHKVHVRQKKTGSFRFRLIRDVHREGNEVDWLDGEDWHCVFPLSVERLAVRGGKNALALLCNSIGTGTGARGLYRGRTPIAAAHGWTSDKRIGGGRRGDVRHAFGAY